MSSNKPKSTRPFQEGSQEGRTELANSFIIATGPEDIKPDVVSRKLIRHHVMKGRNRKRLAPERHHLGSWNANQRRSYTYVVAPIPAQPSISLNSLAYPFALFPGSENGILQCIYDFIPLMTMRMFPFHRFADVEKENKHWVEDLSSDPAYFQAVSYCAQTYFDIIRSKTFRAVALMHIDRSIVSLQHRITQKSLATTDSTIFLIIALILVAKLLGDLESARKHLRGLRELLQFRGGITALSKKLLRFKCCRLDLSIALATGTKPLLVPEHNISWKLYLISSNTDFPRIPIDTLYSSSDSRLLNVWADLREIAKAANVSSYSKDLHSPSFFQEALISVQYRLQNLAYESPDEQEILRLAMLAFSSTIFFDCSNPFHKYENLALRLRTALELSERNFNDEWLRFIVWLIIVMKPLVPDGSCDYPWLLMQLSGAISGLGIKDWAELKQILESFLWVDMLESDFGAETLRNSVMNAKLPLVHRDSTRK